MTPKEKAKELIDKMYGVTDYQAKQSALVAIEFAREFITGNLTEAFDKTMYLFEIKTEIEKL
jgi:hypothetical protein